MRIYLIAGEASGDLHGANLVKALFAQRPSLTCRAWGGDLMQNAGATLVKHYRDLAFMGFVEVLKNLATILRNIAFCKRDILDFQPDVLVLIDYPGFNMRIAKWAKKRGIRVVYYIAPQLWAWHASRAHALRRDVDKLLVILPFEPIFFQQYNLKAYFVGHPLLDELGTTISRLERPPKSKQIALLPGSRTQEVSRILPRMLEATRSFPEYTFVVAGASSLSVAFYQPMLKAYPNVQLKRGETYNVLRQSCAALVKSGTSTLETALLDVPQVVCYAGSPISYQIAKRLVNVQYISLVNLIMDQPLVQELIQDDLKESNLVPALRHILSEKGGTDIRAGYAALRERLGGGGASERAAEVILQFGDLAR